jgi:hypothetical protein
LISWNDIKAMNSISANSRLGEDDESKLFKPVHNIEDMERKAFEYFEKFYGDDERILRYWSELSGFEKYDPLWTFDWRRYIGEYPLDDEFIRIIIDDRTGKFILLADRTTDDTCSLDIKVKSKDAVDVSKKHIEKYFANNSKEADNIMVDEPHNVELSLVYPNKRFIDPSRQDKEVITKYALKKDLEKDPGPPDYPKPRLAYKVQYNINYDEAYIGKCSYEVKIWVDASSGEIIGGGY